MVAPPFSQALETIAVKRMSKENTGAEKAEEHSNYLDHRNVLIAPLLEQNGCRPAQSNEFRRLRKFGV
jgi:hypothetical protein